MPAAQKLKRRTNSCKLASVSTLLKPAPRGRETRKAADQKTAVARHELEAMMATWDESLEGLRDRALLCFGFASGGRFQ